MRVVVAFNDDLDLKGHLNEIERMGERARERVISRHDAAVSAGLIERHIERAAAARSAHVVDKDSL